MLQDHSNYWIVVAHSGTNALYTIFSQCGFGFDDISEEAEIHQMSDQEIDDTMVYIEEKLSGLRNHIKQLLEEENYPQVVIGMTPETNSDYDI